MKNLICVISVLLSLFAISVGAQNNSSIPRYDLVSYGTGTDGTYSAEVFVYLPKPNKNVDVNIRKAAVHGVIFKGLTAGNGGTAQRAMADASAEMQHSDFFASFFNDANALSRYVDVVASSLRVEKVEKKLYRIRAIVSLKKDALRAYLEQNKIIESFKDLF